MTLVLHHTYTRSMDTVGTCTHQPDASAKHGGWTYLGDENASEGIGDGGIDADEIKLDGAIRETLDSDG